MADKLVWTFEDMAAVLKDTKKIVALLWEWAAKEPPPPQVLVRLGQLQAKIHRLENLARAGRRGEYDDGK